MAARSKVLGNAIIPFAFQTQRKANKSGYGFSPLSRSICHEESSCPPLALYTPIISCPKADFEVTGIWDKSFRNLGLGNHGYFPEGSTQTPCSLPMTKCNAPR